MLKEQSKNVFIKNLIKQIGTLTQIVLKSSLLWRKFKEPQLRSLLIRTNRFCLGPNNLQLSHHHQEAQCLLFDSKHHAPVVGSARCLAKRSEVRLEAGTKTIMLRSNAASVCCDFLLDYIFRPSQDLALLISPRNGLNASTRVVLLLQRWVLSCSTSQLALGRALSNGQHWVAHPQPHRFEFRHFLEKQFFPIVPGFSRRTTELPAFGRALISLTRAI